LNARKAELALVWNTVVWGATFVLVKAALNDVTPILFLALRFSLATAALVAPARWPGSFYSPATSPKPSDCA
jgi:drug/metabolite transporter (DMT)-like permease